MADRSSDEMHDGARAAWTRFLALIEPVRPDLARYCRRLTGDIWDAEDLAQDALLRGFALLGFGPARVENLRAYVLRIATNLWIDSERRRLVERSVLGDTALAEESVAPPTQETTVRVRDAASVLMGQLAPRERAAVVLKDVLDLSLEESAAVLGTTAGAVKAALSRGRGRLNHPRPPARGAGPDPVIVDLFVERFNTHDLPGLLALMLDSGSVEMPPVVNEMGRRDFERDGGWFAHSVGSASATGAPRGRSARRDFRGEPLVLGLTTLWGAEVLTSLTRLETVEGRVARVRCYTFCPDAVLEVGKEMGLACGPLFYSFPPFLKSWQDMPQEALR